MTTTTVTKCLTTLFSLFGMPAYIHSDRGATFMSEELRTFLIGKGVATGRTTSYNLE
jgi:transposase InsO family protein